MKLIRNSKQMQVLARKLLKKGKTIGLVPTMGALHEGHLSLMHKARVQNDIVVVSIFVNPAQFGPKEDYLKYPRPFTADKKKCADAGVDYLFVPSVQEMYPDGYRTFVEVHAMPDVLCGASRPGHFKGVTTIVAKLFNSVMPVRAYFGLKDYQQIKIIKKMAADLNFPVTIIPCPTVRESSGLALSSRNQYLTAMEKQESKKIYAALVDGKKLIKNKGTRDSRTVIKHVKKQISRINNATIDYVQIANTETLEYVTKIQLPVVIAAAVWVGKARLIDNIVIH